MLKSYVKRCVNTLVDSVCLMEEREENLKNLDEEIGFDKNTQIIPTVLNPNNFNNSKLFVPLIKNNMHFENGKFGWFNSKK